MSTHSLKTTGLVLLVSGVLSLVLIPLGASWPLVAFVVLLVEIVTQARCRAVDRLYAPMVDLFLGGARDEDFN